jgi:putative ABC transport system substrate-binding protein
MDRSQGRPSRRRFVQGLGVASVALLAGCGRLPWQAPAKVPRLGLLLPGPRAVFSARAEALLEGLRRLGYVEGQNIVVEDRYVEGNPEALDDLVGELVRLEVDLIATAGPGARAAARATSTVPIVFAAANDPVGSGLVASFAQPGGNVTGVTNISEALDPKRLELLKTALPGITRVARLWDPETPRSPIEGAAQALGVRLQMLTARSAEDLDPAFETAVAEHAEALIVSPSPVFQAHHQRIVDLAAKARLPGIYGTREYADSGGLIAYGHNNLENYRHAARLVDKILKGANPANLPVEQPTTFDYVINLRTAQALGLTIPQHVLLQATEVIQ